MNKTPSPKELIAIILWSLPDEKLLQQAETQSQKDYWYQLKLFYLSITSRWVATLSNPSTTLESLSDCIYKHVEAKRIDRIYYQLICRRTEQLLALYEVLEVGEKYIISAFSEHGIPYPFTVSSLFTLIVQIDAENSFKVCLEPYKKCSAQEMLTASKLAIKFSEGQTFKPEENRSAKYLSSQFSNENTLYCFAISVCEQKAQQDKQLERLLARYTRAIGREAKVDKIIMSRTRSSKTFKKPRSHIWSKGQILYAEKYGGIYKINKT